MDVEVRKRLALIVRALYFSMEERGAQLTRSYNLSSSQQLVLFIVSNRQPITITQISQIGCWHVSTVTRLLKPLIREQYVQIRQEAHNQKIKFVNLTEAGRQVIREILTVLADSEVYPFDLSRFSGDEIASFLSVGLDILRNQKGGDFSRWVETSEVILNPNDARQSSSG